MSSSTPPNPDSKPQGSHFSFSHLNFWARAGIVIACILVAIFILSTTILCVVRRGRLFSSGSGSGSGSSRSSTSAVSKRGGYRKPEEKGFTNSAAGLDGEESGYGARVLTLPEEVALQDYRGGGGYGYGYGYGKVGREGEEYRQRQEWEGEEREYRPRSLV